MRTDDPWYIAVSQYLLREWRILASAPAVFLAALALSVFLATVVQQYVYGTQLQNKDAQIQTLRQQLALSRDRLDAANARNNEDRASAPNASRTEDAALSVGDDERPPVQSNGLYGLEVSVPSLLDVRAPALEVRNQAAFPISFSVQEFYVVVNARMVAKQAQAQDFTLDPGAKTSISVRDQINLDPNTADEATMLLGLTVEYGRSQKAPRFVLRAERRCSQVQGRTVRCEETWNSDMPL